MTLSGRAALVTGAGSGIGEAIAKAIARAGGRVCVMDLDGQRAESVSHQIDQVGGESFSAQCDATRRADVEQLRDSMLQRFGRIDVLVNNAGMILPEEPIGSMSENAWDRILDVNLKSQFLCAQAVAPVMSRQAHGRIVNISSRSWLGGSGLAHYAAAKAGVIGLTRSLALELGPRGITVNSVAPGGIDTPLFRSMPLEEQERDRRLSALKPIARLGKVEDVAFAVLFFASDEAEFITGQVLYVCGGKSITTSLTV